MAELRQQAKEIPVERLAAAPARYTGELLYFDGRVLSVHDQGNGRYRARVGTGGGVILLTYDVETYWGQPLVVQDRVRLVGYFRGLSEPSGEDGRLPLIEVFDLLVRFT